MIAANSGLAKKSVCTANYRPCSREDAERLFRGRDLYIWGAGQKGRGFRLALERNGFTVKAFLDNSAILAGKEYSGLRILHPKIFLDGLAEDRSCFILVASAGNNSREISGQCERAGLVKGVDYVNIQELNPFYPTVEIAGACNLKCISCPRGSLTRGENKGGFMSATEYSKVIHKLVREMPFLYLVDLYIWGDPFLNPELSEIIKINSELGIASGISTNLNSVRHLAEVIKSGPGLIRVSASGFGPQRYEVTHTGGKWDRFYNNLMQMHQLINKYNTGTIVEIYYHAYKNNLAESTNMLELCKQYGFRFHPVLSMLLPDFALESCEGKELPDEAKKADQMMLVSMQTLIENGLKDRNKGCLLNRVLPIINWNMSVMPCCNYSYQKLADNYLDVSLDEIIRLRMEHPLCITCQNHGLHRYFNPEYYAEFVKSQLPDEVQAAL